jgi:hypothetical protein
MIITTIKKGVDTRFGIVVWFPYRERVDEPDTDGRLRFPLSLSGFKELEMRTRNRPNDM